MASVDHNLCKEMAGYVELLTTSGNPNLDESLMKKIKKICKLSDEYVKHAYHLLMTELQKEHAEIRYSTFQIIEQLFKRSHQFRELLVNDFQDFLELTVETDPEIPLPPPKQVAKNLKSSTLRTVQEWYDEFAEGYKKLALGYNFLKNCKKVDFQQMRVQSQAEERAAQERERKLQIQRQEKLNSLNTEMQDTAPEIADCLIQLENCFKLLLPDLDEFEVHNQEEANLDYQTTSINNKNSDSQTVNQTQEIHTSKFITDSSQDVQKSKKQIKENSQIDTLEEDKVVAVNKSEAQTVSDSCATESDMHQESQESEDDPSSESESETEYAETDLVRQHGLGSRKYNLSIMVDATELVIKETDDNTAVLHCLFDLYRLVTVKFLPGVLRWLEILSKNGGLQDKIKQAIDVKRSLEAAKKKYDDLKIDWIPRKQKVKSQHDDDEEEEDNFEDVPEKEGYEADIPEYLKAETENSSNTSSSTKRKAAEEADRMDPTTFAASMAKLRKILHRHERAKEERRELENTTSTSYGQNDSGPSTSSSTMSDTNRRRQMLLKKAPVVNYGVDLNYWGEEKVERPMVIKYDSLHRFWSSSVVEDFVPQNAMEMLQTRAIQFTGKFEPVKWKCRAPLSNGKLCQRMDRTKCPFHGKIIARDQEGKPANPKDAEELAKRQGQHLEEWQDPEFLQDIAAQTGRDLTVKKKGKGKGKQKKYPNLMDLKATSNTSRTRLESKVLNRKAVNRVADAMDRLEQRKKTDLFHHTFQSTFSRTYR